MKTILLIYFLPTLMVQHSQQLTEQQIGYAVQKGVDADVQVEEENRLIKELGVDKKEGSSARGLRVATGGTKPRRDLVKAGRIASEAYKGLKDFQLPDDVCPYTVPACDKSAKYRTPDGSCNNLGHPNWGRAETPQRRFAKPQYDDDVSKPRSRSGGRILPSARLVSTTVHPPDSDASLSNKYTHFAMQWGQFLDHDITLTPTHAEESDTTITCCAEDLAEDLQGKITQDYLNKRPECFPIMIPQDDRHFTDSCMNFIRSVQVPNLECTSGPAQHLNAITAYVDASNVYGSSKEEQDALREHTGGRLKVAANDLLPEDSHESCIKESVGEYCFLAGDVRVNEQPGLASMHTIFVREHNRIARLLKKMNGHWRDEKVFQETRKIVGAIMQQISYSEYLPHVIGDDKMKELELLPTTSGHNTVYDYRTDATIRNEFSTAAYRFGHSLIRSQFTRGVGTDLSQMFFRPIFVSRDNGEGVDSVLEGLGADMSQKSDNFFSTQLTDKLFEESPGVSFDLVALNIQRGRDHGIPSYNKIRKVCGLPVATDFKAGKGGFTHHTSDVVKRFTEVYGHPDDVDLFSAGISETRLKGALVGPTFACLIGKQFAAIKFGDRFWYENNFKGTGFTLAQLNAIKKVTAAKVICENSLMKKIQRNIFKAEDADTNPQVGCADIDPLDLSAWEEFEYNSMLIL